MPTSLQHLTCCIAVAVAVQAGAAGADPSSTSAPFAAPSMSEEMLRLWQLRDAADTAPQSVSPFNAVDESGTAVFDAPSQSWRLGPAVDESSLPSTSVTTSTGRSLTPNLDRLLQHSYQPLVPSDAPLVTSTATRAPWGEQSYSKSGSNSSHSGRSRNGHSPGHDERDGDRHDDRGRGHGDDRDRGHDGDHHGGGDCGPPTPTPEPATMLLFGGAAAAAAIRKRRQRS